MLAAVDIGTNTVRLLYGQSRRQTVLPHTYLREITRLGGGYQAGRGLAPEAMERTLSALKSFAGFLQDHPVSKLRLVATAGLRMAENRDLFCARALQETGLKIEIISGEEEARLSAQGVLSALAPLPTRALIFDIGGGSCEFLLVEGATILKALSYPLGVVTLTEAGDFIPPVTVMLQGLRQDLGGDLCRRVESSETQLVGTAGTVTTLAALHLEMTEYDWRRVNNLRLTGEEIHCWQKRLLTLSVAEREALPGMEKGRGDLVPAGVAIICGLLDAFAKTDLVVSDFGLLEGVLLSMG